MPNELFIHHIFKFFSPEELCLASSVCRKWRVCASDESLWKAFDLTKLFPSLKIIDGRMWNAHFDLNVFGLSLRNEPILDKRKEIPFIKKLFATLKIEGDAGITRLTLPQGLTFNKLVNLADSPKQGDPASFKDVWSYITKVLGEISVDKTQVIYISNSILEGSRNLDDEELPQFARGTGCEMPEVLPAATLAILTYVCFQKRLYGADPWTYTLCSGDIVVGGFGRSGLVASSLYLIHWGEGYGVGAMKALN
ncbi:MAG TPA: F-box protein [Rhabdochlamydiaceae bacterium]|nr:F-box protein [Rhabdochlamydiaceae bacterium]